MITLITGIPGMGKTSYLVTLLMQFEKAAERPIFVMGIPDLKIEHIPAPPVDEWTERRISPEDPTLELAYFTFPPNAILVVDEAQRVYRPRASASKVPDHVAALETHRHTGLDIILLTQKPKLIDLNVRELVGKHIHIRAGMLGRMLYEWPHVADGESRLDRQDASRRKFSPPKKAFSKYKSAEAHTKHKFRIHNAFLLLAGAAVFTAYQGWSLYSSVTGRFSPDPVSTKQDDEAPVQARSSAPDAALSLSRPTVSVASASIVEAMTPVDPRNPLSAPLYAVAVPPVVAPEVVGCIASRRACSCYSQQQTPIWLPDDQCRQRAAGLYYDPYRQRAANLPPGGQNNRPASSAGSLLPPEGRAPTADGSPDVIASPA